jgi:UDP-glucuronate decarboxylase
MHPNDGRVVSNFIVQALSNAPITIYGDGSQTRSFCYVDDLVDGLVRLMASEAGFTGPLNLGNPSEITIGALAEQIVSMTGARSAIDYQPAPRDDPSRRCPDITLAGEQLDWAPRVGLEEGLKHTVAYFEKSLLN